MNVISYLTARLHVNTSISTAKMSLNYHYDALIHNNQVFDENIKTS